MTKVKIEMKIACLIAWALTPMMRLMTKVAGSFFGRTKMWRKYAGFLGHLFYFMMIIYLHISVGGTGTEMHINKQRCRFRKLPRSRIF